MYIHTYIYLIYVYIYIYIYIIHTKKKTLNIPKTFLDSSETSFYQAVSSRSKFKKMNTHTKTIIEFVEA